MDTSYFNYYGFFYGIDFGVPFLLKKNFRIFIDSSVVILIDLKITRIKVKIN